MEIKDISNELKNNIMEFINAPLGIDKPIIQSHPQAYNISCLLPFTSSKLESQLLELNITDENRNDECLSCIIKPLGKYLRNNFCTIISHVLSI